MFSFLKKFFQPKPAKPRLVLPSHPQPQPASRPAAGTQAAPASPKAKEEWAKQAAQKISPDADPEALCGIEPGMTREQISAQLAILYRRHNRAASSLEPSLRDEAELMLEVIASMRQKHLS